MSAVLTELVNNNYDISTLKNECIKTQITPKFIELFRYLNENPDKFEAIILSGGTTILIEWILEKQNVMMCFKDIVTNPSHVT